MGNPRVRFLHRLGLQGAAHDASFLAALDEAGRLEHREVFHEAGQRHLVLVRKLGHRLAALLERREHMAPSAVGQGGEDHVEVVVRILNHWV
jgi:hypothetical protein